MLNNRPWAGPQHPASHGVLTLILYLSNEYITFIDICIGYLHRGTEKLLEFKSLEQCVPYFDRLDYVSVVYNEHMFTLAFESLLRCSLALRVSLLRLLFLELTRVFNGLLAISCMVFDLGAISPLLWSFEERDKICTFFDYVCGCRMHVAFICLCGCLDDLSFGLLDYVLFVCLSCMFLLELFDLLLLNNRISYLRLRGISLLVLWDLCFNSVSGVLARSVGLLWDCRLFSCYELYLIFTFDFSFSLCGDAQDRFCLRLFDMRNSLLLCKQVLYCFFSFGFVCLFELFVCDASIELIIYLFYMVWCLCVVGLAFSCIEAPKGEYCVCLLLYLFLISRVRIRCADYLHCLLLDVLCRGFLLADLVAIIGNIDCVFGSVDR